MKSLKTLIKVQKSRVDEQRLLVASLQEQLTRVENDIRQLEQQKEEQKKLVGKNPELGLTYGAYIKEATVKSRALEKKRKTAEMAVQIALDKMAELFEEQKRYEIAEENRIEEERREEARKERITLDEIGSIGFVRKKRGKGG